MSGNAAKISSIDIHCMVLHIHVPFSGKVMHVSGRYNFKKVPIQDILLGSDLHIKHLTWLSLPPIDIGYTSAMKAPL